MFEALCVIFTLGFLYLGVRTFMKFREIASWKSDDDLKGGESTGAIPRELQELRIEEPGGELGSLDGVDENTPGQT